MSINCCPTLIFTAAACLAVHAQVPAQPAAEFVDPEAAENTEVREIGERAINRLGLTLVNEVSVPVAKGGPAMAVDVCHLRALPLTGEVLAGMPRITAVKRTSLKLRNPANTPDAAEQLARQRVERDLQNGTLPKVLVQRIDRPGGKPEWRVYRPVGVAPQCVTCHGPRESLAPELLARLKERYPEDQATGYAAGQWRGLIRVSVGEAPSPPATAAPQGGTSKKS